MKQLYLSTYLLIGAMMKTFVWADSPAPPSHGNPVSDQEIKQYRDQGPLGLQAFLKKYESQLQGDAKERYRLALDQVCQQKDCYASHLYWYTDLEQAKAVAKQSHKPILTLRLLGNLSEDLSCANSRFFRVALYPNAQISKFLQDHYILHWESVRPVPKMTIDFGDGRVLKRTITGNSIHYVLDAEEQIIDALPGMYGPQAFLVRLQDSEQFASQLAKADPKKKAELLNKHYLARVALIERQWKADLEHEGIKIDRELAEVKGEATADRAGEISMSKMRVEDRLVMAIFGNEKILSQNTDESAWFMLAQLHVGECRLDESSRRLIQEKQMRVGLPSKLPPQGEEQASLIGQFEKSMAMDTVRNTYVLQHRIYGWLARRAPSSLKEFNTRVYRDLFLTPSDDPYFGLRAPAYSGIDGDGI